MKIKPSYLWSAGGVLIGLGLERWEPGGRIPWWALVVTGAILYGLAVVIETAPKREDS